jgi:hypothetical protein
METLETIFGTVVVVLAAAAVIGALCFVILREAYLIRDLIRRHRRPGPAYDSTGRWWRERSAVQAPEAPEVRPLGPDDDRARWWRQQAAGGWR